MSRNSKLTFAASCLFATVCVFGVHYMQELDVKTRRVGILRDDVRRSDKRIENELEMMKQEELRKQLEKNQSVTSRSYLEQQDSSG
ncbi:hypothetical protein BATDEDRAFT_92665 [Batrachochytrium dendrobatidis JAM81]|uniref:Uncharacterized protein n=1 Tax=Batrachochytrium dendrobatidis (strain JAM81 / FGSC 10211) TaxID=684364 RepID=F4PE46_BATDJ|nr:uncharacterized protein BATDEDRAFT_92665 [Batrachochytrium dendrobatidis JAM81]EGF76491.1 hypothetical protein BATDEDRAFT_92665 [Batrachochytrium dendrobatidis JAM81]KAJ8331898.1 hypothetical protein O5D80_000196 [Batrachochytrium dendrobatidis]KAK5672632.1 hypothetical protein QVD99_000151 [Batrachochytrium dendrobatidis]|eukprot:XP_006682886.1 hypothetical protein BATDEDRAFT_92665 [Batrachochytrium dendrobatidis JAM81]